MSSHWPQVEARRLPTPGAQGSRSRAAVHPPGLRLEPSSIRSWGRPPPCSRPKHRSWTASCHCGTWSGVTPATHSSDGPWLPSRFKPLSNHLRGKISATRLCYIVSVSPKIQSCAFLVFGGPSTSHRVRNSLISFHVVAISPKSALSLVSSGSLSTMFCSLVNSQYDAPYGKKAPRS